MKVYNNPAEATWASISVRPQISQQSLDVLCKKVFADVAKDGDDAVLRYTKEFDKVAVESVVVTMSQIKLWAQQTDVKLQKAIDIAYNNIQKFHEAQVIDPITERLETTPGVVCWRESRPIERVGLYVPGETAPLISTVLMLGVPAQIAGCSEVVLCTPPSLDGAINPAICYAALKVGVTKVVCVGGIQAIACLTVGTQSLSKVDKIFGPGNQYVVAAKQYAQSLGVAIDMPAGPSEVMVIADDSAKPEFVAADLLSQAEHGTDSQVMLVATSEKIAQEVLSQLDVQVRLLPRRDIALGALKNSKCIVLPTKHQALSFANVYAPEHLILSIKQPRKWAKLVKNAGSVFLGNYSPESAGDYASGSNHTLPTNGWAKSYSGVSLDSFVKKVTFQQITKAGIAQLGNTITTLAEVEGLEAHARAVTIRISKIRKVKLQ